MGVVGGGLAPWMAPRAAVEIKTRAVNSVRQVGHAVSGPIVGRRAARCGLTLKGQKVRDNRCDTVVRTAENVALGAQDLQRYMTDAKNARSSL